MEDRTEELGIFSSCVKIRKYIHAVKKVQESLPMMKLFSYLS